MALDPIGIPPPPDTSAPEEETIDIPTQDLSERTPFEDWKKEISDAMLLELRAFSAANDQPRYLLDHWFRGVQDSLNNWLGQFIMSPDLQQQIQLSTSFEGTATTGGATGTRPTAGAIPDTSGLVDPTGLLGISQLTGMAANWLSQFVPGFDSFVNGAQAGTSSGTGTRAPTAAELRAQFDETQLTEQVQKLARAYLVEDISNPGAIAKAYIESVVKSGGEQKIDFTTFVTERLKATDRWKQIYRNAPEGIDPLQYITPYANAALSTLGGNRGQGIGDVVGQGAALGASGAAFNSRLNREDAVKNSVGYITGLEERMSAIKNVLRG